MSSSVLIYTVDGKLQATGFDAQLMSSGFGLKKRYHFTFICECSLLFKDALVKALDSKGRRVYIDGVLQNPKLSKKNAYNSRRRIVGSVLSTMICNDYNFFISKYPLMSITERINHKGFLFEVIQNRKVNSIYNFIR